MTSLLSSRRSGVTLLELSLVMVIISLIVGGIFVGRSLIRSAELKAVLSESARYMSAINEFKAKYHELPGDFSRATQLWGAIVGDCNTVEGATPLQTCDGDGNGRIVNQDNNDTLYEQFAAWKHLSNAGFIDASLTGTGGEGNKYTRIPGINIPPSKVADAGWGLISLTLIDINSMGLDVIPPIDKGDFPLGHLLWFGGKSIEDGNRMGGIITAEEALEIDKKADDGMANYGKIIGQYKYPEPGCVNQVDNTLYNTDSKSPLCGLIFKTGF